MVCASVIIIYIFVANTYKLVFIFQCDSRWFSKWSRSSNVLSFFFSLFFHSECISIKISHPRHLNSVRVNSDESSVNTLIIITVLRWFPGFPKACGNYSYFLRVKLYSFTFKIPLVFPDYPKYLSSLHDGIWNTSIS